jgi:valyl-tRNA synthetase
VNKLWNATRFIQMQVEQTDPGVKDEINFNNIDFDNWTPGSDLNEVDKWILTSLQNLIKDVSKDIENYQYSNA